MKHIKQKMLCFLMLLFCYNLKILAQKRISDFYSNDANSAVPTNLVSFAGKIYFLASNEQDRNLWVSDGTVNGTKFFLATEPPPAETNQLLSFVTDSVLYIFSQQNLWQIDRKQQTKKLNSQPLLVARYISEIDQKIFYNAVDYYDLKQKRFGTMNVERGNKTGNDYLLYFAECSHAKLRAFSFYGNAYETQNKVYVLEPNQNAYTTLALGSRFAWRLAGKIYHLNQGYYSIVSEQGIFKFSSNQEPEWIERFDNGERLLHQYLSNDTLHFVTANQNRINQYIFDGKKTELISSENNDDLENINGFYLIKGDSLFYAIFRKNDTQNHQIVHLSKTGKFITETVLPNLGYYNSNLRFLNDSLISFTKQDYSYGASPSNIQSLLVNIKTFKFQYVAIGEPTLLPNGHLIGSQYKKPISYDNISLFNATKNTFLIPDNVNKSRPKTLGIAVDELNKTLFIAVNEYEKGKAIYAFKSDSDTGKLIFSQKDSSFSFVAYPTATGGNTIVEDILFYNSSSAKNYSQLTEIDHKHYPYNVYVYDHQKNIVFEAPQQNIPLYSLAQKHFEIEDTKIREVDFFYRNTLKNYVFPTQFQSKRMVQMGHQFYFWGAENGLFANQIFAFDALEGTFKRIIEKPVLEIFQFKGRPVALLQSGQILMIDAEKDNQLYYLFDVKIADKQNWRFQDLGDFFILNDGKTVYYSDGNCSNSGKVITAIDETFWQINRIPASPYYTLQEYDYQGKQPISPYLCKGTYARRLNLDFANFQGVSNKYAYFTIYRHSPNYYDSQNGQDLYQLDLKTLKYTFIDFTTAYSTSFKPLVEGKKWLLLLGNKQYTITDKDKSPDTIEILEIEQVINSSSILYTSNKNTLLFVEGSLILKTENQNKILAQRDSANYYLGYKSIQSNEYIYVLSQNGYRIKRVVRISKQDFSVKMIDIPHGVLRYRTRSDIDGYFQIYLLDNRLYGIVDSPAEGQQLWVLDEVKQTQILNQYQYPAEPQKWFGSAGCILQNLNQVIPTENTEMAGIFPNPTSKYLFLNLPKEQREDIQEMLIIDVSGRTITNEINQSKFSTNSDLINLDLPILPSGVYFLKIRLSLSMRTFKFMVL